MDVAVGLALAVAVTVGVAVAVLVAVGVAVGGCDALAVADDVGLGVPVAPPDDGVPVLDARPGDAGTVAVPLATAEGAGVVVADPTEGEKIDGTEEPPPLQAATDPESKTVAAAQPTAVSLALLTFMRPPCIPGWQWP